VKPNLTLTLGTGWQIDTPLANLQFGGKDVFCFRPGRQSAVFPNAPQDMIYPGDQGCDNTGGLKVPFTHFGPRVGFAYAPGTSGGRAGKLSIRGGVGYYYNRAEEEGILQNLGTPPFSITSHGVTDMGKFSPGFANPYKDITSSTSEPNPFPFVPPSGASAPASAWITPMSLNAFDPAYTTPQALNYNLTVQRELPGYTVVSVGYVGAAGRHLIRPEEGNPITLAGQQACLTNTGAEAGCPAAAFFQHAYFPQNSVYPGNIYGSVGTQSTNGSSNYNALQASVNKGLSHGLTVLASFTWSHSIDDGSGFEDSGFQIRAVNPYPQFAGLNRGDSTFDARKRLVVGYTYLVPGLGAEHHLLNLLVGGWQFSGITTFQTGFPVNISDGNPTSLTSDFLVYYDLWEAPQQIAPVQTGNPRTNTFGCPASCVNHVWFNGPATFQPAVPTLGGPALFGVQRNSFHGPGLNNWDFAIFKNFNVRPSNERMYLQLRLEGYNVFNHTQFCNTAGPYPCIQNNVEAGNFGQVTTVNPSRLVQLGAKFYF
jgi:hypothetical protein